MRKVAQLVGIAAIAAGVGAALGLAYAESAPTIVMISSLTTIAIGAIIGALGWSNKIDELLS